MCAGAALKSLFRRSAIAAARPAGLVALTWVVRKSSGAAAEPIAKACALSVALLPWGESVSSACSVGSGRSPPEEISSGARTGAAISTEAATAPCHSSSSTSVTAVGRWATLAEGKTASATPAAVVAGSEPPTRVVLLVAKEG